MSKKRDDLIHKGAKESLEVLSAKANAVRDHLGADVYIYSGSIRRNSEMDCIRAINEHKTDLRVALLILCTDGGDPDAAYRIARAFQRHYDEFVVLVDGYCYSAGTLIALGAHELVLSEHAVLGPLDTQIAKSDELFASTSGLTGITALDALRAQAYRSFEQTVWNLTESFLGDLTLKTAIDTSLRLTTALYEPVFAQIEPMKLGEDRRALDIARHYGTRLAKNGQNLEAGALEKLMAAYPSHSFVIDSEEAKELFSEIREPSQVEKDLLGCSFVPHFSRVPNDQRTFFALSTPNKTADTPTEEVTPGNNDEHPATNGKKDTRHAKGAVAGT